MIYLIYITYIDTICDQVGQKLKFLCKLIECEAVSYKSEVLLKTIPWVENDQTLTIALAFSSACWLVPMPMNSEMQITEPLVFAAGLQNRIVDKS